MVPTLFYTFNHSNGKATTPVALTTITNGADGCQIFAQGAVFIDVSDIRICNGPEMALVVLGLRDRDRL